MVDGYHIACLWLTFFFRYFPELVRGGYIYLSCPPRYQVTKNKKRYFAYDDQKLQELKDELGTWDDIAYIKGLA